MKVPEKGSIRHENFQGIWPALFTPAKEGGSFNVKELEKLIELLIGEGVDGLYLLGSTGQGFLYSEEQRKQIARISLEIINKRVPTMVQVGALSTEESVRLAQHAAKYGADGISSVGPIYYGPTVEMAVEHYSKIAGASDLPFFPYQIGHAASNELIDKLVGIRNVAGMKLTTLNMLEIANVHNRVGDDWKLFSGADELLCQAALCGTVGAIGTTYNLIGYSCKIVRQQFLNGNVAMSIAFMLSFQKLIDDVLPSIWWFFRRAMLLKHNIDIGDPHLPLLPGPPLFTDEEIMEKITHLEKLANSTLSQPI